MSMLVLAFVCSLGLILCVSALIFGFNKSLKN